MMTQPNSKKTLHIAGTGWPSPHLGSIPCLDGPVVRHPSRSAVLRLGRTWKIWVGQGWRDRDLTSKPFLSPLYSDCVWKYLNRTVKNFFSVDNFSLLDSKISYFLFVQRTDTFVPENVPEIWKVYQVCNLDIMQGFIKSEGAIHKLRHSIRGWRGVQKLHMIKYEWGKGGLEMFQK